jgi:hypothetical protein
MQTKWMTLAEIALDRHITLDEARRLVDTTHCPAVFKTHETLYLL